ncbi:MAG: hypothetical protein QM754_14745 [Tepidisphaeraceae bacterium]
MEVPAELAGEQLQCPTCRRLVDVPRPGELDAFNDDGTVRMDDAPKQESGLLDKFAAFSGDVDMRPSYDEFVLAGTGPEDEAPRRRPTPKYDPVTGELIVPIEILNDDLPPAPKIDPNAPVLGYARSAVPGNSTVEPSTLTWWNLPWRLLTGMSLMAMIVVFVVHFISSFMMMLPGFFLLWVVPSLLMTLTIIAHYCNTMEDFGPNDRERVPVLLRSASFEEDVFRPLFLFGSAVAYSFGPLILVAMFSPKGFFEHNEWAFVGLLAWAMLVFPLSVFTTVCGGTLHNLMPHRMASVVKAAPLKLMMASFTVWLAMAAYLTAWQFIEVRGPSAFAATMPSTSDLLHMLVDLTLTYGAYAAAVYLMHVGAGWLGLIYRDHHADLDWLLQRHEKVYRQEAMSELFRRRGRPVVTPGERRQARLDADERRRRALPVEQHEGFEVKM